MLLETFESQPFLYRLPSVIEPGGSEVYNLYLVTSPRIYGEAYDGGGELAMFLNQEPLQDGYEVIYLWVQQAMVFWPSYNYMLYRFNSTTGEYLGSISTAATLFVFSQFAQSADGTIYRADDTNKVYKCQIDPLLGVTSDGVVLYNLSTFAGVISLNAFNINAGNSIALIGANVENQLRVHDLGSGALLRTVTLPGYPVKIMVQNDNLCYVLDSNSVVSLIDFQLGELLSVFKVQESFTYTAGTLAFDSKYNRFLAWTASIDTTGQNTGIIIGYFPAPQPVYLTDPIPLAPPRQYETTPIYTRLCGDMGESIGGVTVSLASSDTTVALIMGFPAVTDGDGESVGTMADVNAGTATITASCVTASPIVTPALLPTWSDPLPAGVHGLLYTTTLTAYGGVAPYSFACPGLPAGLAITGGSGVITGTPTTPVTALPLSPTVTDSATPPTTIFLVTHITIT